MKLIIFLLSCYLSSSILHASDVFNEVNYIEMETTSKDIKVAFIRNKEEFEVVDINSGESLRNFILLEDIDKAKLFKKIKKHFEFMISTYSIPIKRTPVSEIDRDGYSDIVWSDSINGIRIKNKALVFKSPFFSTKIRENTISTKLNVPETSGFLICVNKPIINKLEDVNKSIYLYGSTLSKSLLAYKPSPDEKKLREEIFKKRRIQEEKQKRQEEKERQQREEEEFLTYVSEPRYGIPLNFWLLQHKKDGDKFSSLLKLPKGKTKVVGAREKRQSLDEDWIKNNLLDGDPKQNSAYVNNTNGFWKGRLGWINGTIARVRRGNFDREEEIHIIAQCFQTQQEAFDGMATMRLIDVYHQDNVPVFEQIKVTLTPEDTAEKTRINALKLGDINLTQTPLIDNSGLIDTRSVASAIWFVRNNTAVMIAAKHPSVSVVDMARKIDKRIQEYDTAAEQRRNKKETN